MIGWRAGSTATSEQTSVSREARRSLTIVVYCQESTSGAVQGVVGVERFVVSSVFLYSVVS